MIAEFFLNIVFNIVSGFFGMLPEISWSVETSAFQYFMSILQMAGYVFPWSTVVTICGFIFGLSVFRVVISFIKTIWDLLPFV